jgi:hypothetical protein
MYDIFTECNIEYNIIDTFELFIKIPDFDNYKYY